MNYEALLTLTLENVNNHTRNKFYEKLNQDNLGWEKHEETETTWSKSKPLPYGRKASTQDIEDFIQEVKNDLHEAAHYAEISSSQFKSVFTVGVGKTTIY